MLTVGLPVFAAQILAFAVPQIEVARFAPWHQQRPVDSERVDQLSEVPQTVAALYMPLVSASMKSVGFVATAAPADATARALRFVVLRYRQAV